MSSARSSRSVLPECAVLEMTYRCNHRCQFCSCPWYAGMIPVEEEMTPDEWCELIETYAGLGVANFTFTGGEALLKPGLADVIGFAGSCRARCVETVGGSLVEHWIPVHMNLLSNGRAMNSGILDLCAKYEMNLSLSLPGLRTFPELTGSDTGPETVLGWLGRAKQFGVSTTAGIAVTRRNLPELYETVAAALLAGADTILLNRFLPGGRGLSHPELELTAEEVREAARVTEQVLTLANRVGHFGTELPRCLIDPDEFRQLKVSTGCSAARDFFTVGPSGKLRGCNHSPVELCSWLDHASLAQNPDWRAMLFGELCPESCSGCEFLSECAGGCREAARVKNGDPRSPDPVFKHFFEKI